MTDEQITLGETYRLVERIDRRVAELSQEVRDRHHALSNTVNEQIGPLSVLKVRVDEAKNEIDDLRGEMKDVKKDAAFLSGGISLAAFILSVFGLPPWSKR